MCVKSSENRTGFTLVGLNPADCALIVLSWLNSERFQGFRWTNQKLY